MENMEKEGFFLGEHTTANAGCNWAYRKQKRIFNNAPAVWER